MQFAKHPSKSGKMKVFAPTVVVVALLLLAVVAANGTSEEEEATIDGEDGFDKRSRIPPELQVCKKAHKQAHTHIKSTKATHKRVLLSCCFFFFLLLFFPSIFTILAPSSLNPLFFSHAHRHRHRHTQAQTQTHTHTHTHRHRRTDTHTHKHISLHLHLLSPYTLSLKKKKGIEPLTAMFRSEAAGALTMAGMQFNKKLLLRVGAVCGFSHQEADYLRVLAKDYNDAVKEAAASGTPQDLAKARGAFNAILDTLNKGPRHVKTTAFVSDALNHVADIATMQSVQGQRRRQIDRELRRYNSMLVRFYTEAKLEDEKAAAESGDKQEQEHNLAASHAKRMGQINSLLERLDKVRLQLWRADDL